MTADGLEWQVTTARPTAVLHTLTGWALERGVDVPDLSVRRPSLEDVYLDLVGEGSADATAIPVQPSVDRVRSLS